MDRKQSREEWLSRKVAAAHASVVVGQTLSHEEAKARMAAHRNKPRDAAA